jgi:hypothetical protein
VQNSTDFKPQSSSSINSESTNTSPKSAPPSPKFENSVVIPAQPRQLAWPFYVIIGINLLIQSYPLYLIMAYWVQHPSVQWSGFDWLTIGLCAASVILGVALFAKNNAARVTMIWLSALNILSNLRMLFVSLDLPVAYSRESLIISTIFDLILVICLTRYPVERAFGARQ